jgi:hypothetical protein
MQSRDFCYWLQGFFELSDDSDRLSIEQIDLIKRHLALVFAHEFKPMARERPATPSPEPSIPEQPTPAPPVPPLPGPPEPPIVPYQPPMC